MNSGDLDIDPCIEKARLPSPAVYTDPDWHQRLLTKVIRRSWSVTPIPPPSVPGVHPFRLYGRAAGEPLLWSRSPEGDLFLLSNICTHRAAVMHDSPSDSIRCPYHGRRFTVDGEVCAAPGFPIGHPSREDRLSSVPYGSWGPIHFATLDPAQPLEELLAPLEARAGFLKERLPPRPQSTQGFERDSSWLLYCDNYLEGLHIPFVHPGLARSLQLGAYRVELFPWGSLQLAPARPGEPAFQLPPSHPDAGQQIAAWYFWLFPHTMVNIYPWGISINRVVSLGPERMAVHFDRWSWDPDSTPSGAGADLDIVEAEDADVVLRVAEGVRGQRAIRGRYAPEAERGVHHFHRLLQAQLSGP